MVQVEECFEIAALDGEIPPNNPLTEIRAAEAELG